MGYCEQVARYEVSVGPTESHSSRVRFRPAARHAISGQVRVSRFQRRMWSPTAVTSRSTSPSAPLATTPMSLGKEPPINRPDSMSHMRGRAVDGREQEAAVTREEGAVAEDISGWTTAAQLGEHPDAGRVAQGDIADIVDRGQPPAVGAVVAHHYVAPEGNLVDITAALEYRGFRGQ